MADEDKDSKVNAAGIAAVVAALAAGGGGVGLLSGSAELAREIGELRNQIAEIKAEQGSEELRMVDKIDEVDTAAAQRSRRVRDDVQDEIDRLEDQVHAMELQLAGRQ